MSAINGPTRVGVWRAAAPFTDLEEYDVVPTRWLNEQVKRNRERFPEDFMFQLTADEKAEVIANRDHLQKLKLSKILPFSFTVDGDIIATAMLNLPGVVRIGIFALWAFVKPGDVISGRREPARRIAQPK